MTGEQLTLLELERKPEPEVIWQRNDAAGKIGAVYTHTPSGWTVEHCGHPTANYPYLIYTPAGERILAPNGRAWRNLALAKQYTETHYLEARPL